MLQSTGLRLGQSQFGGGLTLGQSTGSLFGHVQPIEEGMACATSVPIGGACIKVIYEVVDLLINYSIQLYENTFRNT